MKSISDVVSGAGLAGYAEIALLIFFLVFVAIGLRVLFSGKHSFREASRLPLDDGSPTSTESPSAADPADEVMHA
jgi:cbb3-type cytochrome oxidase subunit 3